MPSTKKRDPCSDRAGHHQRRRQHGGYRTPTPCGPCDTGHSLSDTLGYSLFASSGCAATRPCGHVAPRMRGRQCLHIGRCRRACLLRGYRRACSQNDRLGDSFPTVCSMHNACLYACLCTCLSACLHWLLTISVSVVSACGDKATLDILISAGILRL